MLYFDNAAATKVNPEAVRKICECNSEIFGNASSSHRMGVAASRVIEEARRSIAESINALPDEIIFTSGGTESNNLALKGAFFAARAPKVHMVSTSIEHPSILECLNWLSGFKLEFTLVPVSAEGIINPEDVRKAIRKDTVLVSVMHTNNEIGSIQPLEEVAGICLRNSVIFHTDASQGFTKDEIDVRKTGIDMMTLSSHKIHGPKGAGALYLRKGLNIEPLQHGGGQENGLRAGTYDTPAIAGFGAAVTASEPSYIKKMKELRDYLLDGIRKKIPSCRLNGSAARRAVNNINIRIPGVSAGKLASYLNKRGIIISTGSACYSRKDTPSHVLLAIGLSEKEAGESLRITISRFHTRKEIDELAEQIHAYVNGSPRHAG